MRILPLTLTLSPCGEGMFLFVCSLGIFRYSLLRMTTEEWLQQHSAVPEQMITVRVRPGAKRTLIKDILSDGCAKIDIAAPPEDGEANAELVRFLAEQFNVPSAQIAIISGQTSRRKMVKISR